MRDNSNSPQSLWIDTTSQFKSIRGGQIIKGLWYGQNECIGIVDKGENDIKYFLLNILWLVSHRIFGDAWQIDKQKIEYIFWIVFDFQWDMWYSFVFPSYFIHFGFYHFPDVFWLKYLFSSFLLNFEPTLFRL